jgi:4-amino-4-deoxy-L-arabinose transferase-like glycosyltransferase
MKIDKIEQFLNTPWAVALAFLVLVAPFALQYQLHYPDEIYYTNGSLIMHQTGDYFTPHLANGNLRFNKPIVTYWVVLAGHWLFGFNPVGARFFFLLAGALTVLLTFAMAKLLTNNKNVALLSSLIVASHPTIILSSTRSIPDILLCLFTTLTALGVAGLIKHGAHAPKRYLWYFYMGIALAFEVKGLPALAMGGLAGVYLLANPWQRIPFKTFVHLPSLLVSMAVAFSWYVAMYLLHADVFISSFMEDQVGIRVGKAVVQAVKFLFMGILFFIGLLLPWILFSVPKFKERVQTIKAQAPQLKAFSGFTVLWVAAILGMSALVVVFYERYLLPVVPVAAVWLAQFLTSKSEQNKRYAQAIQWFFVAFNGALILFGGFLNWGIGTNGLEIAKFIVSVALLVWAVGNVVRLRHVYLNVALLILLVFFNATLASSPISIPGHAEQARSFLNYNAELRGSTIGFYGNIHVSSRMRMGFGDALRLVDAPEGNANPHSFGQWIVEDVHLPQFAGVIAEQKEICTNWEEIKVDVILRSIVDGTYPTLLQQTGKKYYWVKIGE